MATVLNCVNVVVVAVDVVQLPQAPDDDHHKRSRCAWKADELVTVGTWV